MISVAQLFFKRKAQAEPADEILGFPWDKFLSGVDGVLHDNGLTMTIIEENKISVVVQDVVDPTVEDDNSADVGTFTFTYDKQTRMVTMTDEEGNSITATPRPAAFASMIYAGF